MNCIIYVHKQKTKNKTLKSESDYSQGLTLTLARLPGASKTNVGASESCYQVARSGKCAF